MEIARLYATIGADVDPLEKGFKRADKDIHDFSKGATKALGDAANVPAKAFGGLFDTLGRAGGLALGVGALAGAASGVVGAITGVIGAASDVSESINKVNVVFGSAATGVLDFGKTAARGLGMSRGAALEAAGTFGNLFVSMGLGQKDAAGLSTKILTLGSDLASFNNIKPEEALEKLRAGLVGESEPLRALGVNMNEAMVKAMGLKLGLADAKGELSESAKVQARYAIIMEQTKTAQGDFANTSTGMANAVRIINASFADVGATIGEQLLPVVAPLVSSFAQALPHALATVKPYLEAFGTIVGQIGPSLAAIWKNGEPTALEETFKRLFGIDIGPFAVALYGVGESFRSIADAFAEGGLGAAFGAWLSAAGEFGVGILTWVGDQVEPILTKLGEWGAAFVNWIGPLIPPLLVKLGDLATAMWTWVTDTALPATVAKLGAWGTAFLGWVTPVATALPGQLVELGEAALTWIGQQAKPLLEKLREWAGAFVDWIGPIAKSIGGKLVAVKDAAVEWIGNNWRPLLAKLGEWGTAFVDWIGPVATSLAGKLDAVRVAAVAWIGEQASPILSKLGEWGKAFVDWIVPATTAFLAEWPANLTRFLDWIEQDAAPAIAKQLSAWVSAFSAWVGGEGGAGTGTAVGGLLAVVGNIAGALFTFIEKTAEVLAPRLLKWAGLFLGWVATSVVPFLAEKLGEMLVAIGTWLVNDAIPWAGRQFLELGKAIVAGIVAGIKAAPNAIGDALKSLVIPTTLPTSAAPAAAPAQTGVVVGARPRFGEVVAQGPNADGKYLYLSDGGRHGEWRDRGGPGVAGQPYMIGTGAQPELFVPRTAGEFFPRGGYGGAQTIVVPVSIDGREVVRATARVDERQRRRGVR